MHHAKENKRWSEVGAPCDFTDSAQTWLGNGRNWQLQRPRPPQAEPQLSTCFSQLEPPLAWESQNKKELRKREPSRKRKARKLEKLVREGRKLALGHPTKSQSELEAKAGPSAPGRDRGAVRAREMKPTRQPAY